jgi:hypothetical protein
MPNDLPQFTADLSQLEISLGDRSDRFVSGVAVTLANEMISGGRYSPGTPIDTGFHRANWDSAIGVVPNRPPTIGEAEANANPGAGHAAANAAQERTAEGAATLKVGQILYVANSGPAIGRLEFGWSKQAPNGMIRQALNALQSIANEVATFLRGGS